MTSIWWGMIKKLSSYTNTLWKSVTTNQGGSKTHTHRKEALCLVIVLPVDRFTTTRLELCLPNTEVTVVILSIINGLRTVRLDCKGNCTLQSIAFEITRENYYSNVWGKLPVRPSQHPSNELLVIERINFPVQYLFHVLSLNDFATDERL